MESKYVKNWFYIVGLSLKTPVTMTWNNCLASWSHVAYSVLCALVIAMTVSEFNLDHQLDDDLLRTLIIRLIQVSAIIILVNIATNRKQEALFWDLCNQFSKANKIFIISKSSFINWSGIMLLAMFAFLFVPSTRVLYGILCKTDSENIPISSRVLLHMIVIHATGIKLIYFLNKLEQNLKHLRLLLSYQIMPIEGLKKMKNLYKMCWQMNGLIEDIFGLPLVLIFGIVMTGTIYNTYLLFVSFDLRNSKMSAVLGMFAAVVEICIITKCCHNCYSNYRLIKGLAFLFGGRSQSSSFAMQLMHQKILISPRNIFNVDHMVLVAVSSPSFLIDLMLKTFS